MTWRVAPTLKRRVSDAIYAALVADTQQAAAVSEGPGGELGNHFAPKGGRLTPRAPTLRTSHSRASPTLRPAAKPAATLSSLTTINASR